MGLLPPVDHRRTKSEEGSYELVLTSPAFSTSTYSTDSDASYFSSSPSRNSTDVSSSSLSDIEERDPELEPLLDDENDGQRSRGKGNNTPVRGALAVYQWVARRDPLLITVILVSLGTGISLFIAFPFPTTVHVFIGLALGLTIWTLISWARIVFALSLASLRGAPKAVALPRWSTAHFVGIIVASSLVIYWFTLGLVPGQEVVPALGHADGSQPKYFIAANLFNNQDLFPRWGRELEKLIDHLGRDHTFVSIYESNSNDRTPQILKEFSGRLDTLGVRNNIRTDHTDKWWPYGTSPQRIGFLSNARNNALEPLQSANESVRLPDYDQFTKVVFFNDVVFSWQSVVRLIATSVDDKPGEEGYDLACGMDYSGAGLYDTWVARDICGTPMRLIWPHVKDPVSKELVRQNRPFEVSACWNGVVAFPARPYLYIPAEKKTSEDKSTRLHDKRGWKIIDDPTYPDHRMSPALQTPLQFRISGVGECDHSECFLFSYDLHRFYHTQDRPPRIIMNPHVMTTYSQNWWAWRNIVLQIPAVQWWQRHWSHGLPLQVIDWIWEAFRKRDFCTWTELAKHAPERCPELPGPWSRQWNE